MGNGKLKVAVISGGMIANAAHIPAYRALGEGAEVVAVCDINAQAAQATAQRWGIPGVYTDTAEMLEKESPDLVSVCTSNASHKPLTILALEHGANVLCEKPLAVSWADAREMFAAADRAGRMLFACQSSRFNPEHLDAWDLAQKGWLGQVYFAEVSRVRRRGVPSWGNFHKKAANGGGALCDIGVHVLDTAIWLMGNPRMSGVSGAMGSVLTRKGEGLVTSLAEAGAPLGSFGGQSAFAPHEFETEEFAAGTVRFEGGAILNFKVAWALNLPNSSSISIVGDRAGLLLPEFRLITTMDRFQADVEPRRFAEERPYADKPFSGHWRLIRNVADAVLGRAEALVKPEETLNVTAVIDAFYRSAALGREVRFPELAG
ncbi:MAG TPA: Gfo/Idh/MocA family oxidoreductase [Candidatus Limnocylindria bacterium]|nr:Gfo/Idh/MocA family oxidoreductase [Candidatus Limnocylindria bacterium]